jgi:ERCC4-type nuclease
MLLILCDSREQAPLDFSTYQEVDKVEVVGLPFGDYTAVLDGSPVPVCFERKSIADLWGTMTSGYERFRKEMLKAKECGHKLILITEGTYSDVANGFDRSKFSGDSMLKKLHTLYVKYDLEWFPCDSRKAMAHHIVSTFSAILRFREKTLNEEEVSKTDVTPKAGL